MLAEVAKEGLGDANARVLRDPVFMDLDPRVQDRIVRETTQEPIRAAGAPPSRNPGGADGQVRAAKRARAVRLEPRSPISGRRGRDARAPASGREATLEAPSIDRPR